MKAVIITLVILSTFKICTGQSRYSDKSWDYYKHLSEESNKKHYDTFCRNIFIDSLNNVLFEEGKGHMWIDTLSYWKILFEYNTEYESDCLKRPSLEAIDSLYSSYKNKRLKCIYDSTEIYCGTKIYCGSELFKNLEIDSVFLNKNNESLKYFPFGPFNIDEKFNGIWTPFIFGDYLLLRHAFISHHSRGFSFEEKIIYFNRIKQ